METNTHHKKDIIYGLIDKLNKLPFRDKTKLDEFMQEAQECARSIFGNHGEFFQALKSIRFAPASFYSTAVEYQECWEEGKITTLRILTTMLNDPLVSTELSPAEETSSPDVQNNRMDAPKIQQDLDPVEEQILDELVSQLTQDIPAQDSSQIKDRPTEGTVEPLPAAEVINEKIEAFQHSLEQVTKFSDQMQKMDKAPKFPSVDSKKIFIVHGFEKTMLQPMTYTLATLGLELILSHERTSQETIAQKLSANPDVGFAIVLLTEDDIGYRKDQPDMAKLRAKQNVVYELGYLIGKLGRDRVFVLHHDEKNFELPTHCSELIYTPYDRLAHWQFDLVKRLKSCDYKVDANKLL